MENIEKEFHDKITFHLNENDVVELNIIVESLPDAVYIGDFTGVKISNQLALDMLGFDSTEDLNQSLPALTDKIKSKDLQSGKRLSIEEEPYYRALLGEKTVKEIIVTNIKSHKEIIVRSAAAPVISNGKIIGAIAINSDITDKIQNRLRLNETVQELQKKNESLDKFVYITSHDLKAPLNSLIPLLTFLKEEYKNKALDKEAMHMLNLALQQLTNMSDLIHSLLNTAKSRNKEKEEINLNEAVRNVIENLAVPEHIQIFIKHNLPVVKYHRVSMIQVLQNILSNAIKYMDKDSGLIKISCAGNQKEYTISISDNGPGIDKKDFKNIFDKFKIAHELDSTVDSSGLGLSIAKEIIEENNGKIWVESVLGDGATFYFTILK